VDGGVAECAVEEEFEGEELTEELGWVPQLWVFR
jgi:hypothetical protein